MASATTAEMNKPSSHPAPPAPVADRFDTRATAVTKTAPINPDDDLEPASQEQLKGGGCAPCCVLQ